MCGIVGIWSHKNALHNIKKRLQEATDMISHRGPDGEGHWTDESIGIALGHRRLAIVDLSIQGQQPMISDSGRYVIVFNGEIYNHQKLRQELPNQCWRGSSDTETLLAAIENWGLKKTLQKSYGMFALAIFDYQTKSLFLARDRVGEKPLYYGFKDEEFLFSSELKSIFKIAQSPFEIDKEALSLYFRRTYVPTPYSILKNIFKLEPGHFIEISFDAFHQHLCSSAQSYWNIPPVQPSALSFDDNKNLLTTILNEVIQEQIIADVPLGAFLSGGIDSSIIVALMQRHSSQPIKTFSIGFESREFDEAPFAKKVAQHLQTDHTELYLSEDDMKNVVPLLSNMYDEPFADSSQIPTYLVSKLARQHVTVSLSGDGGDELFGGYTRYKIANNFYKKIYNLHPFLKKCTSFSLQLLPKNILNQVGNFIPNMPKYIGNKLHVVSHSFNLTPEEFYERITSCWYDSPVTFNAQPKKKHALSSSLEEFLNFIMRHDMKTYLPDDILVKVDRASMAVGLEARVPFLDARVIDFSQKIKIDHKFGNGMQKRILRELLHDHIPKDLIDRPKKGFKIPLENWLRGSLKEWATNLLATLPNHPYLDSTAIRNVWNEHQSKNTNQSAKLWSILMYLAWYERFKPHLTI